MGIGDLRTQRRTGCLRAIRCWEGGRRGTPSGSLREVQPKEEGEEQKLSGNKSGLQLEHPLVEAVRESCLSEIRYNKYSLPCQDEGSFGSLPVGQEHSR